MNWISDKLHRANAARKRRRKSNAAGHKPLTVDQFVTEAVAYRERLQQAPDFNALQEMWRATALPYKMRSTDPFSDEYRAEVLSIYEGVVGDAYVNDNELSSTRLSEEDIQVGYPWVSQNLSIVASELGKAVNGMRAIAEHAPAARSVIEFGAGWGNTAVPLARAGLDVAAVDIDPAFLRRIEREAQAVGCTVRTIHADFVEAARDPGQRYDAVMFSSSFHHCLDFEQLLREIHANVLAEDGAVFFFAEPVSNDLLFPWGLRYDGEAVWAITCNKWLELGFSEDFFHDLMARTGFTLTKIPDPSGYFGPGWVARKA